MSRPIVAVADLHGHASLFQALLARLDADLGQYRLVTLGDYVDNGEEIPQLLDLLIDLQTSRPDRFFPIIGNHDLACLLSMGWADSQPDEDWYDRWATYYWNPGLGTAPKYGAGSGAELDKKMPVAHRQFLEQLPWYFETDGFFFVHAGLEARDVAQQRHELATRQLQPGKYMLPQLRDKTLSTIDHPDWGCVVVSGHTKKPARLAISPTPHAPHFITERRITLSAEVDAPGRLYAITLPERVLYEVARDGQGLDESHCRSTLGPLVFHWRAGIGYIRGASLARFRVPPNRCREDALPCLRFRTLTALAPFGPPPSPSCAYWPARIAANRGAECPDSRN